MTQARCEYIRVVKLLFVMMVLYLGVHSHRSPAQSICNGLSCSVEGVPTDLTTFQTQLNATPKLVKDGEFITQNTLRTDYPCGAGAMLGRYARVLDIYQTVASVAICETDGTTYYWRPQRTDYATTTVQSSGTITLTPFVTSPVLILSNSPNGNITITPSSVNAWPGAQFRVIMPASINALYAVNISGLVGNNVITAIQGRDYVITYTTSGWKSS